METTINACRCGHHGDGPHPCHADGYKMQAAARAYDEHWTAFTGKKDTAHG